MTQWGPLHRILGRFWYFTIFISLDQTDLDIIIAYNELVWCGLDLFKLNYISMDQTGLD
jgi:hypothetical protein